MTFCAPSLVTPRQSCILFAGFLGVLIACIAMPRALCFLPAVYGVGALVFLWCKTRTKPVLDKNLACWLTAILALSGLSAIWAIDPAFALERSIKTACVFLSCYGIIVMARNIPQNLSGKDILAATGVVLCAVSALSIFMEYKTGFFITRHFVDAEHNNTNAGILNGFILNRNLVYLILLCLPVTLMLYLSGLSKKTKIILGASLLACLLMVLSCTKSQTAQISAVVAIIMVFYPAHKKKARQAMALGIVTVMLAMPFIIQPAYTQYLDTEMAQEPSKLIREASVVHRLEVWNFIAGKALEQPFLGHGTESTRFMKSETRMEHMNATTVLHPHNIFLQIWVEFGIIGISLAAAFLLWIIKRFDDMPTFAQKYYGALLVTVICITSIGYGMWQGWQIGMIFALIAFSMAVVRLYGPRST